MGLPPVLVLNLRRSVERRAHMEQTLRALAIEPRFVEAVDVRDLPAEARPPYGVTRGEWACLRTHLGAWRLVAASAGPAVVLEDDVLLAPGFPAVVRALGACDGLVLLGSHSARYGPERGAAVTFRTRALPAGHRLGGVAEFPMGAYAYFLPPAAAARLLASGDPPHMPLDWVTGYAPRAGVRLLAVTPPCVWPHPALGGSTIDDRDPVGPPLPTPLRERARRALGAALLLARRAGLATTAYTWRAPRPDRVPR